MKILFVLEHFYPYIGGAEKLFYELTTSLAKKGFSVIVITTQFDKKLPTEEIHEGVKIVRVICFNRFGFTILSLPKVIKYAKGCHLIHTTTYNAALPSIIAGQLLGKPVIVTFHEVWGDLWKKLPFISWIEKYAFFYFEKALLNLPFDTFVAVSDFTKSKLMEYGVPNQKIVQIYNGIDYSSFYRKHSKIVDVFTFTYFGRLGVSKGLDILIPAAADFRKLHPDSKFKLIIPKQPKKMYSKIMSLISRYDLTSYVEIHHELPQAQLDKELLHSTCIVIPSYSEGFCFAAAEAVALNIPIVSSNKGALREVVSGRFINMVAFNSRSLQTALEQAFYDKWDFKPIQYFHLDDSVDRYQVIYDNVKK